jgi:uncharacterized protein YkwD
MRWSFVTALIAGLSLVQTGVAAAEAPQDRAAFVSQVVELTNAERQKAGLDPLTLSNELQDSAQSYSDVLASGDCFQHTCGPVPDFADRDNQAGYANWTAIGENIAAGYPTPEAVVAGWMASPGHRANMLSSNFTEIGVGMSSGAGKSGTYCAEEFGRRAADTDKGSVDDASTR